MRQYVTAKILLHVKESKQQVVPFVVSDKLESMRNTAQVAFMIKKKWLCKDNLLTWAQVEDIRREH